MAPVSVFVKSEQLMSSEQEKYETKVVGNGSSHYFVFFTVFPSDELNLFGLTKTETGAKTGLQRRAGAIM